MHLPWVLVLLAIGANAAITPKNMLTAPNTTKPGCQRKCGNLTIPYPFGIGHDCYLEPWFGFECNTTNNPPKVIPVINSDTDIIGITETQVIVRNTKVAVKCFDSQGNITSQNSSYLEVADDDPFSFSSTENTLTVIGCDNYALINGMIPDGPPEKSGCIALCNKLDRMKPGSCLGSGCCQTSISPDWQSIRISLSSLPASESPWKYINQSYCSYAFFGKTGRFNFEGASDMTDTSGAVLNRIMEQSPIVLEWSFVNSCNQTRTINTTYDYHCGKHNTECIDTQWGGHRCRCLPGFEGNPYLQHGCTDIDECAAGSDNPCSRACVNTPGGYKCSCPSGYNGNGLRSGTGCVKILDNTSSRTLKKITLGLGISLGTIVLLFVGWWFSSFIKKRRIIKQKAIYFERNGGLILQQQMATDETVVARMKIFTADELDKATDQFNDDRILGRGGQGTVYKGMLSEGKLVAIKKAEGIDETQLKDFINEVVILSQINHRNIVKLLGCCLETKVPLLVYEFVPNGTLFHQIHYPTEEFSITWKMRLQIASDTSAALTYLHSSSSIPILHRDIKSSNILLDDKYRAKLSDFGTSKSISVDQTHVTTRVMGTFGYLDPEYFQSSMFTEKSDVYSFGVVLVELLTGQKAIRNTLKEEKSLTSWFLSHMKNSCLLDIIDSEVLQEGSEKELNTIADLAMRCLNLDGKRRPTMKEVLMEIEGVMSLHIPEKNRTDWLENEQAMTRTSETQYEYDLSSSSTFLLENTTNSMSSMSLLSFHSR